MGRDEVQRAAERLVAAFAGGRVDDYFACFAPDASFVFYTTPTRLNSVEEYRATWTRWVEDDGFRVLECRSSDPRIEMFGDVGVFVHSVMTRISTNAGEDTLQERETIVFARQPDGDWLAVHEHLSPMPEE